MICVALREGTEQEMSHLVRLSLHHTLAYLAGENDFAQRSDALRLELQDYRKLGQQDHAAEYTMMPTASTEQKKAHVSAICPAQSSFPDSEK